MVNKNKKTNPIAAFLWKNKRQRAKNFNALLMVVILMVSIIMGFVSGKLDLIVDEGQNPDSGETTEVAYDEEELEIMTALESAGSLNDYLYSWANNGGTLYKSKNVINILLLGLDSGDALEKGGRSDTNILLSLNKVTKKINLTSFYRDTWCYMNINGSDRYAKLNSSYLYGGPNATVDTIEKNFKIDIDYYVAVDFSSFVKIIDALGGLTVEVQEYEANYINRTTKHNIEFGPAVTLTGEEALVFARIRKSDADSDVSRTRRQRMVIESFLRSALNASLTQLNDALDMLFSYVKTDMSKMQILSYGTQAITNGWLTFDISQCTISDSSVFRTGYVGNSSVVFMDFPLAAQRVQQAVFDDTNIQLSDDRITIFSLY